MRTSSGDFAVALLWSEDSAALLGRADAGGSESIARAARLFPEPTGNLDRIDAGLSPPGPVVARAMHRTMMPPTEGDTNSSLTFATERARLDESQVVRIGRLASAQQSTAVARRTVGARGCDSGAGAEIARVLLSIPFA
jgi:hypothetical protein